MNFSLCFLVYFKQNSVGLILVYGILFQVVSVEITFIVIANSIDCEMGCETVLADEKLSLDHKWFFQRSTL